MIEFEIPDDAVVFDDRSLDEAIIGEDTFGRAVYEYSKIIDVLMQNSGMARDDAIDYIENNIVGSLLSGHSCLPIILHNYRPAQEG